MLSLKLHRVQKKPVLATVPSYDIHAELQPTVQISFSYQMKEGTDNFENELLLDDE